MEKLRRELQNREYFEKIRKHHEQVKEDMITENMYILEISVDTKSI